MASAQALARLRERSAQSFDASTVRLLRPTVSTGARGGEEKSYRRMPGQWRGKLLSPKAAWQASAEQAQVQTDGQIRVEWDANRQYQPGDVMEIVETGRVYQVIYWNNDRGDALSVLADVKRLEGVKILE